MSENSKGEYAKEEKNSFDNKHLYTIENMNFAAKYIGLKGKEKIVEASSQSNQGGHDALIVSLTYSDISQDIVLMGKGKGYKGFPSKTNIDDAMFVLQLGSSEFELPFSIKLADFDLERYPGSN